MISVEFERKNELVQDEYCKNFIALLIKIIQLLKTEIEELRAQVKVLLQK